MIEERINPTRAYESRPKYSDKERRVQPRLHCKGVAQVAVPCIGIKIAGTLLDLSVSGCRIVLDFPMPEIETPRVEVHLSVKGTALRIAGIVRHIKSGHQAGIEFIDVTSRKAEQIRALFAELIEMQCVRR